MKKRLVICILAVICFATLVLGACSKTHTLTIVAKDGTTVQYTVKDGDTVVSVVGGDMELFVDAECTKPFDNKTPINGDITLYVKDGLGCVVTFVTNGGKEVNSKTVNRGDTLPTGIVTTRQNYTFAGWYTDEDLTQKFQDGTPVTKSMTLYAKWIRTHYAVTFKVSGSEQVVNIPIDNNTLNLAGKIDDFFYDDYAFAFTGWKDDNGNVYGIDEVITVTDDIVLTAQFKGVDVVYMLDLSGEFYILDSILNPTWTTFTVPETYNDLPVKSVRYFGSSSALKEIIIPDSVTYIAEKAFADLSGLESIDAPFIGAECISSLPVGADFIGKEGVFGYWFKEDFDGNYRRGYHVVPSRYYQTFVNDDEELLAGTVQTYFQYPATLKSVTIRKGVIPDIAFYNVMTIDKVTLGDEVTAIGKFAFAQDGDAHNFPYNFRTVEFGANSKFTTFSENSFRNNHSLVSITVPKGVTELPSQVFYDCLALSSVTFAQGNQLVSIGAQAFFIPSTSGDASLKTITFPETLQRIGEMAFDNCKALEELVIPQSVVAIGGGAFRGVRALKHVTFATGNSMTVLESNMFNGCWSLTTVELPANMSVIDNDAFNGCKSLSEFDFGNICEIGSNAFNDTGLVNVTLSASLTKLGGGAFANCDDLVELVFLCQYNENLHLSSMFADCSSLQRVTLPEGITVIDDNLFKNCDSLTSIVIPASVKTIGNNAFGGWFGSRLASVTFAEGSQLETIGANAFSRREMLTSIAFPKSLKSIGANAFDFCSNLTTVSFEGGTGGVVIGADAFRRDFRLSSIDLSCVVSIGNNAFEDCVSLSQVNISDAMTTMGYNVFARSNNETLAGILDGGLTLDDVKALSISVDMDFMDVFTKYWPLGDICWNGVPDLANVTFRDGKNLSVYADSENGYRWLGAFDEVEQKIIVAKYVGTSDDVSMPDYVDDNEEYEVIWGKGVFEGNKTVKRLTIAINEIPENFCKNCASLEEVVLINTEIIGTSAFEGATSLTKVTATRADLREIGDKAFRSTSLTTLENADFTKVTKIGETAFYGLNNWTGSITLTHELVLIGERAFYNCSKLSITFDGALDSLDEIAAGAFSYAKINVDGGVLIVPANVKYIGASAFQLSYGGNVTALIIEDGVTYIGDNAFNGFSGLGNRQKLEYVLIKSQPTYVGDLFVAGAANSKNGKTPIYFENVAFTTDSEGVVNVPEGWTDRWYFRSWNDDEQQGTYFVIYGKGKWHYDESGVPVGNDSEPLVSNSVWHGVYVGEDEENEYGWIISVDNDGIRVCELIDGESSNYETDILEELSNGFRLKFKNSDKWYIYFIEEDGKTVQVQFFRADKDALGDWESAQIRGTLDRTEEADNDEE